MPTRKIDISKLSAEDAAILHNWFQENEALKDKKQTKLRREVSREHGENERYLSQFPKQRKYTTKFADGETYSFSLKDSLRLYRYSESDWYAVKDVDKDYSVDSKFSRGGFSGLVKPIAHIKVTASGITVSKIEADDPLLLKLLKTASNYNITPDTIAKEALITSEVYKRASSQPGKLSANKLFLVVPLLPGRPLDSFLYDSGSISAAVPLKAAAQKDSAPAKKPASDDYPSLAALSISDKDDYPQLPTAAASNQQDDYPQLPTAAASSQQDDYPQLPTASAKTKQPVPQKPLKRVSAEWQKLSLDELVAEYLLSIIHHIETFHKRGYVYLDLKPDNMLWNALKKLLYVCDNGLTTKIGDPVVLAGARQYEALELLTHSASEGSLLANPKMDIYSLALVLAELLGCRRALTDRENVQATKTTSIKENVAHIPIDFDDLPAREGLSTDKAKKIKNFLMQMIDPDPDERPTAQETRLFFSTLCTEQQYAEFMSRQQQVAECFTEDHKKAFLGCFALTEETPEDTAKKSKDFGW